MAVPVAVCGRSAAGGFAQRQTGGRALTGQERGTWLGLVSRRVAEAETTPLRDHAARVHAGSDVRSMARIGKGLATQPPHALDSFHKYIANGRCYRQMAVWMHNNYTSDPTVAPPTHGSVAYCETDWVWYTAHDEAGTAMFPWCCANPVVFHLRFKHQCHRLTKQGIMIVWLNRFSLHESAYYHRPGC